MFQSDLETVLGGNYVRTDDSSPHRFICPSPPRMGHSWEGNRFTSTGKICVLIGFADIPEVEQMHTDP